jgi:hypothetical protein
MLVMGAMLAGAAPLAAQAADTNVVAEPKDSAVAKATPPDDGEGKLKISGAVTASYTYATRHNGSTIVGRLFDRFHDQFTLDAVEIILDEPVATDKLDAGFHANIVLGQDAQVAKSTGFDLGTSGDVWQAFAALNVPAGQGKYVQFKAGRIATLMGLEVLETFANPNFSEGNQFIFVENFTNTGLRADLKPAAVVDAQLVVFNGWDQVTDINTRKSFMGRLGITPDALTTIGLLGYYGPEQLANVANKRRGFEALASRKLGAKLTATAQFDYGKEDGARLDGGKATWYGYGLWVVFDATPTVNLALRGDYIDDKDGARSTATFTGTQLDTRHKFGSGTATLNIKAWSSALVRPEVRYDRSNLFVFDGKKDQVSLALGVSYLF